MPKKLKLHLTPHNFIIGLSLALILINVFYAIVYLILKIQTTSGIYYEPGYQFNMFKVKLEAVKEIGYISDKNNSRGKNDGTYLQAQYFLAPTILKLNDINHRFLITDSEDVRFHKSIVKTVGGKPVTHNDYGQLLIERQHP